MGDTLPAESRFVFEDGSSFRPGTDDALNLDAPQRSSSNPASRSRRADGSEPATPASREGRGPAVSPLVTEAGAPPPSAAQAEAGEPGASRASESRRRGDKSRGQRKPPPPPPARVHPAGEPREDGSSNATARASTPALEALVTEADCVDSFNIERILKRNRLKFAALDKPEVADQLDAFLAAAAATGTAGDAVEQSLPAQVRWAHPASATLFA